ncbi:MAG: aldehyde dehydrogenase family protein [Sphingomonadales bacterium]
MTQIAEIFEDMSYGPAPEDAGYVLEWIAAHKGGFKHFINGAFVAGNGNSFISRNPASGENLASIAHGAAAEVDAAVAAAKAAFPAWSRLVGHERAKVVYALARAIQKHSRFLAVLESLDNGKPIRETRDLDIPLAARHFYHHAGWAQLQSQEFPRHAPMGVVGQIIPWNFPFLMLAWKIAPAIATGNTVVLKPAEYTSLTALYFAELCAEAGVPPGVINIVTGEGDTGELIVNHPDIAKIAFTGSTEVGRIIRRATAGSGKALSLELGGKSPFLIFEDADLDGAVEGLVDAIWFNQGQVCCAGSRLLVEESVAETVYEKIRARLGHFRIGDPLDKAIDMGALVDPIQKRGIEALLAKGVAEGAKVWQPDIPVPDKGCFMAPTLVTEVGTTNSLMRDEIFGPVLAAMSFRTLEEGVALANNTRYGLAATIWSENINRALDVASQVKAGVVWINTTNAFDAACGFGGYRESGFGREGGREGLEEYLKPVGEWTDKAAPAAKPVKAPAAMIDQTAKNFIGGKQKRPDWGRSMPVLDAAGTVMAEVGHGNRKDIRDAVEAAFKAAGWTGQTGHARAQILYFVAENLARRAQEFASRVRVMTGVSAAAARAEVDASIARLFSYAAWADKYDGLAHAAPAHHMVLATHEPIGVMGIVCPDDAPLLAFVSLWAPAVAMGNRVVVVPSQRHPLAATDFYQVLETSDMPAGVINIVTGPRGDLTKTLADHDQVDAMWYFGDAEGSKMVEERSIGNLKQTWVNHGRRRDWASQATGEGRAFLRRATQVKNIWLPYGD